MDSNYPGFLIVLEGLDGSGTTTQSGLLARYLREEGYSVVELEEPGGTELGRQVREILLEDRGVGIEPLSELFLYEVSRAQMVREKVIPGLKKGKVIISDRFAVSSVAYQGYGRGIPIDRVKSLNEIAVGGLEPDITFYLDIDLHEREKRSAGKRPDRIEKEKQDFYRRVREGYLAEIKALSDSVLIDGSSSKKEVSRKIIERVEEEIVDPG
ncbi:dTMP kinase [Candidatus Bipolaricaulota bacterium]|nr:dTMP kinase [Candidatus Bipolaricaulota bacterium]